MATKGIYNCQSQYTMATPLGSPDPFLTPECCQKWQMGLLWGKESQPLLWQCLKTLLGSLKHTSTSKGPEDIYCTIPQHTMAIHRGMPALFLALLSVVKNGKWACCGARRANHCCGSVSEHCLGPSNTAKKDQKPSTALF